ncbi:Myosin-1 [Hondaea fermentalgiana]|uniref:Myosin-1 n=1 Tax=Hondaea fermentalgiana TaxID=2315210 RepID=A0A2R5G1R9_9STRA|nr:Myosin-1 [Hondaea fermentalgiana]|eukprot:GBG24967.1 Myosin-1 [Hondaea fermentalgiana]
MSYFMTKMTERQNGVDDLTLMSSISVENIVTQLKHRLDKNKIYTAVGDVIIAVNPYRSLPIYGEKHVRKYQTAKLSDSSPHIYALAERAYRGMKEMGPQAVVISGESGAGKTESAKLLLHYVSSVSGSSSVSANMKQIILQSNPLLESFGNAKTLRNNNSSRFGKYLELQFNGAGEPVGGVTSNFLLEKSRVTYAGRGERSFHVFYGLLAGGWPELLSQCQLGRAEDYAYLSQGTTYVDGMDDAKDFQEVLQAFNTIGVPMEQQWYLFTVLGGILHLGNARLTGRDAPAQLERGGEYSLEMAAYLFGVAPADLLKAITHKTVAMGGRRASVVNIPQNADQASQIRDALAKEMYSRIFDVIVAQLNSVMYTRDAQFGKTIGILDIYGFEIFKENGFEQLCINYVNEQLQQIFISLTIRGEQELYRQEGLPWREIKYFDNKTVVELIEGRNPPGIFRVLDDTCRSLHAVDSDTADTKFIEKLSMSAVASHPHLRILSSTSAFTAGFTIKHYAGDVTYSVKDMAFKNMDNLFHSLVNCMKTSTNPFVRNLWAREEEQAHRQPSTSSTKIRTSCGQLVQTLMRCQPHYIRCIKPNEQKAPMKIEEKRVLHQVRYLGLLESVRVAKAGYSYKATFDLFVQRFYSLCPGLQVGGVDGCRQLIAAVLKKHSEIAKSEFVFGHTRIFISSPETIFMLEEFREQQMDPAGYAAKVREYEQMEAAANRQEAKVATRGGGCCIIS